MASNARRYTGARIQPPTDPLDPIQTLERRLADGYARIDIAIRNGEDVTAWEDFWIELLHRYEQEYDRANP